MAEIDGDDKTEQATPRKREQAREKGEVAKSAELSSVAVLVAGVSALYLFGGYMYSQINNMTRTCFSILETPERVALAFIEMATLSVRFLLLILAPVFATVLLVAVVVNIMQVGMTFSLKPLTPQFGNLNPIAGMRRLVSKQAMVELVKSLAKLVIVGWVAYVTINSELPTTHELSGMDVASIGAYIIRVILKLFVRVGLLMVVIAIADYAYQKWSFSQRLKMTKHEVKEEHKQDEGDPLVKLRIRRKQQDLTKRRMMQEVPKADVVVTNPVHLALALQYDPKVMSAPRLVAKGAGVIAEKIKAIAREHAIPVVENKELARAMFKNIEIGDSVPEMFYQAVAQVMAYVYRLKGKT